jgi:NitT/TauT family transport system ATP-binding protein
MLAICGLCKRFDDLVVFRELDFTAAAGSFTVLIGPSGCGKSTLFDVLTGVVAKDAGTISWRNRRLPHVKTQSAYMQQKDLLLPWLNLLENAILPARMAGHPIAAARRNASELFVRLGLEGFASYLPGRVSGGMRQRCALVRTLMFERELVLLDEPLSALDAITRSALQSLLVMLQNVFGKTILMITHDIEEALLLADEILVLSRTPMIINERIALNRPKPRRADDPTLMALKARMLRQLQKELGDASL